VGNRLECKAAPPAESLLQQTTCAAAGSVKRGRVEAVAERVAPLLRRGGVSSGEAQAESTPARQGNKGKND
jgi:hypothetical protein